MNDEWQYQSQGNPFAKAMMDQGNSTSMIGEAGPRTAGIITTLPKRPNWAGEAMMNGVPVGPSGEGLTEFDTDKIPSVFGKSLTPDMGTLVDNLGTKNMMDLSQEADFQSAMGAFGRLGDTDLEHQNFQQMLGSGFGGSAGYSTEKPDGTPYMVLNSDRSNISDKTRLFAHEGDHVADDAVKSQQDQSQKSNRTLPHDIRPHELRAANSASRALFDNRFTNPKSPWFIHPGLEVNNPKVGSMFGMLDPDISTDRLDMTQKMNKKVGKATKGPTVHKTYKKNLNKQRDKVQQLWDNDPEFRDALSPMLQKGISH